MSYFIRGAKSYLLPIILLVFASTAQRADALPSWNEGEAKQSVVSFVERLAARVRSSRRSQSNAAN
ncbi:hypothetical protein [Sinorhizobium meliloti]|uniref:hypothetical protein n=1 Tax=Rhizobium meliloti TaxID=382 RepID=UPI0013E2A1A0|nr:hypothetical protein [Sinorhizobium meliloti]